jgi:arginyl-tRNA synthetase
MRELIIKLLKKALKELKIELKDEEIENILEKPPSIEMGDYAFPCFSFAQKLKQEPSQIALQIRGRIGEPPLDFDDIQTSGPYLNFFLDRKKLARKTIIEATKENFGKKSIDKNKVMIEFSQANTHKAFHVGHIRGTCLGESLARILEFCGNNVIRANYQGDTGMHVAKWLWGYKRYHSKEKIKNDESWIASIYVDATKRLAKHKSLQKQVDEINKKLATGEDEELNSLWKKTRKMSLDSLEKIYKELNTHFDVYFFESDQEKKAGEVVDELLKNKIAKISDEAVIINLEKYNLGVWVLLRKDKTVLYSAKDLALAEEKFKKYKLDKSIYVVANEQDLHLKQLFKTLDLKKFNEAEKLKHVSYGMIRFPHGKMSSRTGDNILYSDFISEMIEYSKEEIKKREKITKKKLEERALKISIAAIKYSMLKQSPNKNIIFTKKDALNFEGDTGPYIQYSYARASSILRKVRRKEKNRLSIKALEQKELELIKKISQFPEIVLNAYKNLNPSLIANYSYQLAQIFNEFYHACPVIGSEQELFRLEIIKAFRIVLKNSLYLLGIDAIEKM